MIAFAIISYLSVAIVDDFFQPLPRMDFRESPLVFVLMIALVLYAIFLKPIGAIRRASESTDQTPAGPPRRRASRRLLVHVDLIAVQVLERHARTVGLNLRLAVELDASVLHAAILAHAVIGHDPKERLRSSLLADQRPVFVRFAQTQRNRHHLIV